MKSGLYQNKGENQVLELIRAAKCTIFFVDNDQQIHIKDIGEANLIAPLGTRRRQSAADETQIPIPLQRLRRLPWPGWKTRSRSRKRPTSGSPRRSLISALWTTPRSSEPSSGQKTGHKAWQTGLWITPHKARKTTRQQSRKTTITAGGGALLGLDQQEGSGGLRHHVPPTRLPNALEPDQRRQHLIIAPDSINEIGCIHTCQGLKLDYVGCDRGPTCALKTAGWSPMCAQRSSMDRSIFASKMMKEDPRGSPPGGRPHHQNTYRTLLTRGMKGCYVYFATPSLRD